MRKSKSMTKTTGRGWVGRWRDGGIGWVMPAHLTGRGIDRPSTDLRYVSDEDTFILCEITVKMVKNKNGKPITRKMQSFRRRQNG